MSRLMLIARGPRYFSACDEKAFFVWLESISCVASVGGHHRDIHIKLKRKPSDSDLRELLGLFFRYRMNMKGLAVYRTTRNAHWFDDSEKYWHAKVFGKSVSKINQKALSNRSR
jgi:hypothetical protein